MKHLFLKGLLIVLFGLVGFCSCSDGEVDIAQLNGSWSESYDDPNFCMDGAVVYTFKSDDTYEVYSYDALSGQESTNHGVYQLKGKVLILNPQMSDFSSVQYNIVKLNSREMAWLKVGTEYAQGSKGSDYRHFVRDYR